MYDKEEKKSTDVHHIPLQNFASYYQETAAYFADIAFLYDDHLKSRTADVTFWVEQAIQYGGPVLEIGCGTGRILVPIAQAGIAVTGLDASSNMLHILHQHLSQMEPETVERVHIIEGHFPEAVPKQKFKQVFLTFGVFQYFLSGQENILKILRECLDDDGRIIIDVRRYNFPGSIKTVGPVKSYMRGNSTIELSKSIQYDAIEQILQEDLLWKVHDDTNKELQTIKSKMVMHVYYRFELEHLLKLSGFEILDLYGDYQKNSVSDERPKDTSLRLIYIAHPQ